MMAASKRPFALLALSLGVIGLIVCIAGMLAVCLAGVRLSRATENVFIQIDASLVALRDPVDRARQRVRAAKVTSEDIQQSLQNWTKAEARDHLASRLGVEEKAERLSSGLQQADHWLGIAESSVLLVHRALELGDSTGVPVQTDPAERLLEELRSLRDQLRDASEAVESIRERTAESGEEKSLKSRIEQALPLAVRVVATLGSLDSRLGAFENRLTGTQENLEQVKATALRWLLVGTVGIEVLLVWMAAGQVALCILSRRAFRRAAHDAAQ